MKTKTVLFAASAALAMVWAGLTPSFAETVFRDVFTQDATLNSAWTYTQLNSASSKKLNSNGFTMTTVPTNGGSDLWPTNNYGASLLLYDVGALSNYTATTRFAFSPTDDFSGAGLILTTQTTGFNTSSDFERVEYEDNFDGLGFYRATNGEVSSIDTPVTLTSPFWLRVHKAGTTYVVSYSANDATWNTIDSFTDSTSYDYVGLISARWTYDSNYTAVSAPHFKSFTLTAPTRSDAPFLAAVPEPSTWAIMALGFVGLGFVGYRASLNPRRAARLIQL
jgi:regulation of enolase protein 1 (concanavalin A-like superfamily)